MERGRGGGMRRGNGSEEVVVGGRDLLVWRRRCMCARPGGGWVVNPPKLVSKFEFLIFIYFILFIYFFFGPKWVFPQ
jgi:hypothetical protein